MRPKIQIAYLAKAKYGGWPTFTKHLRDALEAVGCRAVVRTVGARHTPIDFGHGLRAIRMPEAALLKSKDPILISAADKEHVDVAKRLIGNGANIVVHDPAEKHLVDIPPSRTIVIRRSMHKKIAGSFFIPHPYVRCNPKRSKMHSAIAHSRIDFDKYTHLVLDAIDRGADICIMGAVNPRYVYFKIKERWPDFSPQAFPRDADAGAHLCARAGTVVDMSAIKNDGGGSQYSFMEAWDARTPLVINSKWIEEYPSDEMQPGFNCLASKDGEGICQCIQSIQNDDGVAESLIRGGESSLDQHDPSAVGTAYREFLGV